MPGAKALKSTLVMLLVPAAARAAGADPSHGDAPSSGQWLLLLFTVINFVAFALLFRHLTAAPIRDFLKGRRRQIQKMMAEAAKAKADAEQLREEYEAKVAALDTTRRELIDEVKAIATADSRRLLDAAREAAERLGRDAERTARSDLERARKELRAEAARLAAELATAEIPKTIDDRLRERLVDEFLEGVPGG